MANPHRKELLFLQKACLMIVAFYDYKNRFGVIIDTDGVSQTFVGRHLVGTSVPSEGMLVSVDLKDNGYASQIVSVCPTDEAVVDEDTAASLRDKLDSYVWMQWQRHNPAIDYSSRRVESAQKF